MVGTRPFFDKTNFNGKKILGLAIQKPDSLSGFSKVALDNRTCISNGVRFLVHGIPIVTVLPNASYVRALNYFCKLAIFAEF
jgi:hypothetical protein